MTRRAQSKRSLTLALLTIAGVVCVLGSHQEPSGAQSNFVGGDPSRPDASDIRALRLRFEPGSRSNWHSHSTWQILMAEEGRGRTQEQGGPIQELIPGRPIYTGADIVHWHGAAPDQHMIQLTFVSGQTSWQDPVSDNDYHGR